jgi:hypothetical protein
VRIAIWDQRSQQHSASAEYGRLIVPPGTDDRHVIKAADLPALARALAVAVEAEPSAVPELVVLAGGLTARHPDLVALLAAELPDRAVEGSAAAGTKSAAAWGLRHLLLSRTPA